MHVSNTVILGDIRRHVVHFDIHMASLLRHFLEALECTSVRCVDDGKFTYCALLSSSGWFLAASKAEVLQIYGHIKFLALSTLS